MAQGRDLLGEDYSIVSVIGDGALTGGMAYERSTMRDGSRRILLLF